MTEDVPEKSPDTKPLKFDAPVYDYVAKQLRPEDLETRTPTPEDDDE
ncbi:hypothetical protein [Aeromicrobium sp. 179-A 4D2 NHS]